MKLISKFALTLAAVAALSWATPSFANLVTNGGFETGDFTGWTRGGNLGATGVGTVSPFGGGPHSGRFLAFLGPVGSDGTLSQNLTTIPGDSYTLTYWLRNDGGTPSDFSAFWNGALIPGSSLVDPPGFGYTEFKFQVLAIGNDQLLFSFRQDPAYFQLDDVSVPDGGTTLCLFGLAMIGICFIRRWAPASVK